MRVCDRDITELVSRLFALFLSVDVAEYRHFQFMGMSSKFGSCLYAQIGVTSNGCIAAVNLLCIFYSLIVVVLTRMTKVDAYGL